VWAGPEYTRVVLDVSGPVTYKVNQDGDDLTVDINASSISGSFNSPGATGLYKGRRKQPAKLNYSAPGERGEAEERTVVNDAAPQDAKPAQQRSGKSQGGRRRKKPWRYRWPDEIRDEVLARLLKLNAVPEPVPLDRQMINGLLGTVRGRFKRCAGSGIPWSAP